MFLCTMKFFLCCPQNDNNVGEVFHPFISTQLRLWTNLSDSVFITIISVDLSLQWQS